MENEKLSASESQVVLLAMRHQRTANLHRDAITPTLGAGELPGIDSGSQTAGWLEFLPQLAGQDWSNKTVAIFGLGDQEKYPDEFVDAIALLHDAVTAASRRRSPSSTGAFSAWRWIRSTRPHSPRRAWMNGWPALRLR